MNRIVLLLLTSLVALSSCVKTNDFDVPADMSQYDPNLPVTHTIRQLLDMNGVYDFRAGGDTTLITQDVTIAGIVTGDDRSGNIYKTIYIQDSTAGLQVSIDAYSLYNDFPVGRKVYIKCRGLMMGYDGGTPVIGRGADERYQILGLSGTQILNQIVKGPIGQTVKSDTVDMTEAVNNYEDYVNRLVTITNAQFVDSLGDKSYAQANATTNREIRDCAGKKLAVRTSNYANFFGTKLPTGNGTITGIFTIFTSATSGSVSPQLILRDTSDVRMTGLRCGGGTGGGGGTTVFAETFNTPTSGTIALAGWTNVAQTGTQKWSHSTAGSSSNPYARVSAFGSNEQTVVSWLVTPSINIAGASNALLSFRSADGFDNGATLKVYATNNFTGDVTTTTWTQLNPALAPSSTSSFSSFTSSGNVSLAAFTSGNVWIAWKYEGSDPSGTTGDKTTTWEIDDVRVTKN